MPNRFITVLRQSSPRVMLRGLLVITALIAFGYFINGIDFEESFRALPFSAGENAPWYGGPIGFAVFGSLAICVSCPRQIVSFFAAYFFGLWTGIFSALAASVLGCVLTYAFALLFREKVRTFVRGKLDIAVRFWTENPFVATVIWRFMPAGSNLVTNLAAGALGIPALAFIAGSTIGYVPQTVVFAVVGSGVRLESTTQLLVSIGLFAISAVLGLYLYSRYRKKIRASDQSSST